MGQNSGFHNREEDIILIFKMAEDFYSEDDEYDTVTGAHKKKSIMSRLNRKKLTRYEMDEIFLDWR